MRVLAVLLVLLFAIVGVLFGTLNADFVAYDFLIGHLQLPKGAALLAAAVLGWVIGGLVVWLFAALPARRRLARMERKAAGSEIVPDHS